MCAHAHSRSGLLTFPDIPPIIVVSTLLFVLFILRQVSLNRHEDEGSKPPPLTPGRLFAGAHGQLLALYTSAVFVWGGVDVSTALGPQ